MNHDKDLQPKVVCDLARDLEICNAVTDGPWEDDEDPYLVVASDKKETICDTYSQRDQKFIKHFNPAYVRQLIEKAQRVDELEEFARKVADQKFQGGITAVMAIAAEELLND